MTQYAKTIYLEDDCAWIGLDNEIEFLCNHADANVALAGKRIKELLSDYTMEQISGNFTDETGQHHIWIKGGNTDETT